MKSLLIALALGVAAFTWADSDTNRQDHNCTCQCQQDATGAPITVAVDGLQCDPSLLCPPPPATPALVIAGPCRRIRRTLQGLEGFGCPLGVQP